MSSLPAGPSYVHSTQPPGNSGKSAGCENSHVTGACTLNALRTAGGRGSAFLRKGIRISTPHEITLKQTLKYLA